MSDSGKVVVLKSNHKTLRRKVNVYDTNGQLVCSFGGQILSGPRDITTVSDGRIMMVQGWNPTGVHISSEQGCYINEFDLQRSLKYPQIAFHRESLQVVVVGFEEYNSDILCIEIYTKDGEFVRSAPIRMRESISYLQGIAVTTEGRIAIVTQFKNLLTRGVIII